MSSLTSASSGDKIPCKKMKVQLLRMWRKGKKNKSGNSMEVVLLQSSVTKFQTSIDENFSKWMKDITDEKIDDDDIEIPKDELSIESSNPIKKIVKEVYGNSFAEPEFCHDKAILCHSDEDADRFNHYMISLLPGPEKLCHSDDCLPPRDMFESCETDFLLLAPMSFGSIIIPGVPLQVLSLKVGAPVTLLMDIDPSRGLSTGTRLQITKLGDSMLEARFPTRSSYYDRFLIPKTHMYPDESFPGVMRRTQFPVTLAFAMPINKTTQTQTFSKVVYVPREVLLSDGQQRYVAISKAKAKAGTCFKVLITGEDAKPKEDSDNVVFHDLFQKVV